MFARAETLADRGERDAAIEVLGGIIDRHPESARAHYLMGVVLLDEPGKAEAHFRRALYLDGGHWLARWHRARCMERLGDADAAQQAFRLLEQAASAEPPERMIDEREGITCGLLALMCRQVLR